jgi:hypothetical protein
MKLRIDVEEGDRVVASVECNALAEETVETIASRIAGELQLDSEEILVDLLADGQRFDRHAKVSDCLRHGNRWRHRRSCIDLHFESEEATHRFPASATWGRVHKWGCEHFQVPGNVCANLELRKGSPDGPALNDKKEIGVHPGCEVIWLVKPGPEPNGHSR